MISNRCCVPVEPLESSDMFEPTLWASMTVPPVRTGCADVVSNTQLPGSQHGASTSTVYRPALSTCPSIYARRVSKRRAWGAAQAMRTFRGYRSAVKAGRGGQGASWCVSPAASRRGRQRCTARERVVLQKGSALLAAVVHESHYRRVDSH
jgi:hypothetical protein